MTRYILTPYQTLTSTVYISEGGGYSRYLCFQWKRLQLDLSKAAVLCWLFYAAALFGGGPGDSSFLLALTSLTPPLIDHTQKQGM